MTDRQDRASGEIAVQALTINDWVPDALSNGPHGHWSVRQKKLKAAQTMVWAAAKHEGLQPVKGRVRVIVTLIFAQKRRRDTDNLYARVKGVIDGLVKGGWIEDDNTDVLDLHVESAVSMLMKRKSTRITIEPLAAGQLKAAEETSRGSPTIPVEE